MLPVAKKLLPLSGRPLRFRRTIIQACGAAAFMLGTVVLADAGEPKTTRECAERDLKVMALIEQYGEAVELPSLVLADASIAQLDAREICMNDGPVAALPQYDKLLNSLNGARLAKK